MSCGCDVLWTYFCIYTYTYHITSTSRVMSFSKCEQQCEEQQTHIANIQSCQHCKDLNHRAAWLFISSSRHELYSIKCFLCHTLTHTRHVEGLSQSNRWLSLATQISAKIPTHYDYHQISVPVRYNMSVPWWMWENTQTAPCHREITSQELTIKCPYCKLIHYSTMHNPRWSVISCPC